MTSDIIEIVPVETKKERNQFIKFPYTHTHYSKSSYWVPPLLMDQKILLNTQKHPFYTHAFVQFFLAKQKGQVLGRIAAIIDIRHNETHQEQIGFFGFFETVEDYRVAEKLLDAVRIWMKPHEMNSLRGPVNPCLNEDAGTLIDSFDSSPCIMMPYNPPYYPEFLERYGLKKTMDLHAYIMNDHNPPPEKLIRVAEKVRKRHDIQVRPIIMKNFWDEVDKVWYIYNRAWSKNWGFVPMTKAEFNHLAKNLKHVIVPELSLIAEIANKPVGFSISLPDLNQALKTINGRLYPFGILKLLSASRKIDMIRVITLGVIHDYQKIGIDAILYWDTWRNATAKGFHKAEMSWILENNIAMTRAAKMLGGSIYKTYRIYETRL